MATFIIDLLQGQEYLFNKDLLTTISGSGTLNRLIKFTPDGSTGGNSSVSDDGTTVITTNSFRVNNNTNTSQIQLWGKSADGSNDQTAGINMQLNHNGAGNRQVSFYLSDSAINNTQAAFRILVTGAGTKAQMDAVSTNGNFRLPFYLSSDTMPVIVGQNLLLGDRDTYTTMSAIQAYLQIRPETASAGTAPIKFTIPAAIMTTAEALTFGVSVAGDDLLFTINTGAARKGVVLNNGSNLTSGKYPIATTNGRLTDGPTPLAGTKTYFVANSSGGAVTRQLTFQDGILVSET